MDVSIVAAIGSFIVSERVIKAKATVLFGLLCTVTYDLFIHSNDPVTLRVYRGEQCCIDVIAKQNLQTNFQLTVSVRK